MATVTGFTAARMLEIENTTVIDGHIDDGDLVLVTREGTEIVAGSVVGPAGPAGPNADVGDIKASMRSSLTGWLLMGQSIANANVSYPALWALTELNPWKSGTTLNLPSMDDKILQGGGTLGASTGANTKTLVAANLPPHVHSQTPHIHSMAAHTHPMGAHTHSINHDHGSPLSTGMTANHSHGFSATTLANGDHAHSVTTRLNPVSGSAGEIGLSNSGGSLSSKATSTAGSHTHYVSGTTGSAGTDHQHYVTIGAYIGTSGGASASNTGTGGGGDTGSGGGGDTGNGPGSSSPVNVEQAALRVNFFIKY